MVTIYTTPSCSSCRKAKKWFQDNCIPYKEKNLFDHRITSEDIDIMLKNAENGFDDIISTRSKVFKEQSLNVDDMRTNELKDFILENPSILKRPIIVDDHKIQVGYNDEEIRIFIPRRLRDIINCEECPQYDTYCEYQQKVGEYLTDIKTNEENRN